VTANDQTSVSHSYNLTLSVPLFAAFPSRSDIAPNLLILTGIALEAHTYHAALVPTDYLIL
jgi:hypothetical protein